MLPVIKTGEKLHITPVAENRAKHTYISHVAEQLENRQLLVYTPVFKGNLVYLTVGEDYLFSYTTQNELYQANGTVLKHCIIEGLHYMIIKYTDWQRIQRRTFFRLHCLLDFSFSNLTDAAKDQLVKNLPGYKGIIKNLSGGGMFFVTDQKLTDNDEILCNLKLNEKSITVKGKVRGVEPPMTKDDLYKYRAEFIEMERNKEEEIIRFVFSLQLKIIKKMGE